MKKIVSLMLIMGCLGCSAFANETNNNNNITITQSFGTEADGECFTLRVYTPSETLLYLSEAYASTNGIVTFSYPQNSDSGVYSYIIKGETGEHLYNGKLYYTNSVLFQEVMTDLEEIINGNPQDKSSKLSTLLSSNINVLQLTREFSIYENIKSGDTTSAYNLLAKTITLPINQDVLINEFQSAMLLNAVERGIDVGDVFTNYSDVLGANTLACQYYNKLTTKNNVNTLMSNKSYNSITALLNSFYKVVALESINDTTLTPHWSYLVKTLKDATTYSSLDTGNLYAQTENIQNTVIQKLISYRTFANEAALKNQINTLITEATTPTPSGGGSKSTGGGTVQTAYVPVVKETDPNQENSVFKDLSSVKWAENSILALYKKNIIAGYEDGNFYPNHQIKREEFLKMLLLTLDVELGNYENTFHDVFENSWYYNYVLTANNKGIVKGKDPVNFGIGEDITRQDAVVMINRALTAKGIKLDSKNTIVKFADDDLISEYAKETVYLLVDSGVINGVGDHSFAPQNSLTRAEAAKMLYALGGNK